ncbi:MAG: hypothetical protein AAF078_01845 [Planctomycetota bacterium]
MPSWVRFSVAVYLGLLLAGAVISPRPLSADAVEPVDRPGWAGQVADEERVRGPEACAERCGAVEPTAKHDAAATE